MTANAFDQLAVISGISATFLGFIAVFLVFSNREGRFSESDKHFIQGLVLIASYTIIIALMPGALSFLVAGNVLWTLSLGFAAVLATASSVFQLRIQLKMTAEEAAKIHWGWHFVSWAVTIIGVLLIIAGLLGLADPRGMFIGLASMSVILSLWLFIAVVFRRLF